MKRLCSFLLVFNFVFLPLSVVAQEADLYAPTSGWLVGPASLMPSGQESPCLVASQYSNGFFFRFSGGGEKLLAMAIDFRRQAFTAGETYAVSLTLDNASEIILPASAHDETTLILNLEREPDFYKSIGNSQTLKLGIAGESLEFALIGISDGLKRLESCYDPQQASRGADPLAGLRDQNLPPAGFQSIGMGQPKTEASAQKLSEKVSEEKVPEKVSPKTEAAEKTSPSIDDMLKDAEKKIESETTQKIEKDINNNIVKDLPKQKNEERKATDILVNNPSATVAVQGQGQEMRWRAVKGGNLKNILEVWAQSASGRLIWSADKDFSMPESIAMQGTFEAAVEAVLSQFPVSGERPVGRIYHDPTLKQKVLIIELQEARQESPE